MPASTPRPTRVSTQDTVEAELLSRLRIDDEDLDACLVEQPESFRQAADRATEANGTLAMLELEKKELIARLDGDVRAKAVQDEEKLSETQLANRILILPLVKEQARKVLEAKRAADRCQNLKESFLQRSYALKDLTAIQLSRFHNLGIERGSVGARQNVGDRNRVAVEDQRREARQQGRYRSRDAGD